MSVEKYSLKRKITEVRKNITDTKWKNCEKIVTNPTVLSTYEKKFIRAQIITIRNVYTASRI